MSDFGSRWQNAVHAIKEQLQMPVPNMALDREPVLVRHDRSPRPRATTESVSRFTSTRIVWAPPTARTSCLHQL
jgi:hypothetical protein